MTPEEIRIRSLYIFLACSRGVEELRDRLQSLLPSSDASLQAVIDKSLKRELGLLFRYWTTRKIWQHLDAQEADAKSLNLALLRLFTEAFRLPRDGSGLRYAELSTVAEEVREMSHRMTAALGCEYPELLSELPRGLAAWRETVARYAVEGVEQPLDQLSEAIKEWGEPASGQAA